MFRNYININFEAINKKKTALEQFIYDYMYKNLKSHNDLVNFLNPKYNFYLLCSILNNESMMKKLTDNLFIITDPIIDYYSNLSKLDYYDLCLALLTSDCFEFLKKYKKDIKNRLFDNFKELQYYFLNDMYGVGAFCYLIKTDDLNKIQYQKLNQLKYHIRRKIFDMLKSQSNSEKDITIYNLSIAKDIIKTNIEEKYDLINFIIENQNSDGTWGGPKGFFSSFALDILLYFSHFPGISISNSKILNNSIEKGMNYIIYSNKYIPNINTVITVAKFLNQTLKRCDK